MDRPYRPWGRLPWVLSRCRSTTWDLFGCIGTEDRSLATWQAMHSQSALRSVRLLSIDDAPSRYSSEIKLRLEAKTQEYEQSGGVLESIVSRRLFSPHHEIVASIDEFLEFTCGNIVIDISSLPKRFFFPVVKRTLEMANVSNVLATYCIPRTYPQANLAENFNEWAHLPLFSGEYSNSPAEMLVIGVGFQALGLHEHLKGEPGLPMKLLVPFPASPSAFMRSWELSRQLQRYGVPELFETFRADSRDPSDTFDRLVSLSRSGSRRIALAPFGPKPMSLAMCLFASIANCEVLYTQPSVYHPEYSIGISTTNGSLEIYAYCLKLNGRSLFGL